MFRKNTVHDPFVRMMAIGGFVVQPPLFFKTRPTRASERGFFFTKMIWVVHNRIYIHPSIHPSIHIYIYIPGTNIRTYVLLAFCRIFVHVHSFSELPMRSPPPHPLRRRYRFSAGAAGRRLLPSMGSRSSRLRACRWHVSTCIQSPIQQSR